MAMHATALRRRPVGNDLGCAVPAARRSLAGMETITYSPAGVYPAGPDYAHALELRAPARLLLVSGTMGLDPAGAAGATLDEQLELAWANIRAILAVADMTTDHIVRVTSYLRDAADAGANAAARVAALGGRAVPTTAIVVQTLQDDWLVELEVLAAG
jgi:enamine deaminase RidA (YjgF/YER057c/UK114 family)